MDIILPYLAPICQKKSDKFFHTDGGGVYQYGTFSANNVAGNDWDMCHDE